MTDRLRPTPVRIVQGAKVTVDGTPVDTGGHTLFVVPLGGSAAEARERATREAERSARRVRLRDEVAAFVSNHVATFLGGHTTPGEIDRTLDDGFDGRIELERTIAQFAGDGTLGNEMRELGLLRDDRGALRKAFDAVRARGSQLRNGRRSFNGDAASQVQPVDLVDSDLLGAVQAVYRDPVLRDTLGGQTPGAMAYWSVEQILAGDAAVEDSS